MSKLLEKVKQILLNMINNNIKKYSCIIYRIMILVRQFKVYIKEKSVNKVKIFLAATKNILSNKYLLLFVRVIGVMNTIIILKNYFDKLI